MTKIKIKTATLPERAARKILSCGCGPSCSHCSRFPKSGMHRASFAARRKAPGKATVSPARWAVWSAARSEPAVGGAMGAVKGVFGNITIAAITAAAITIAAIDSTATGRFC